MTYQFDFSKLTIRDVVHLHSNDIELQWAVVHKCACLPGDIYDLPSQEAAIVWNDFVQAYKDFRASIEKPLSVDAPDDDEAVRGMLDGIEGL